MATDSKNQLHGQFCTFRLAGRLFGVDILDVKEVTPETNFTPIFHTPPEVKGYVNIRGKIHLVLDLRLMMGFESKELEETSKVILFKPEVGEAFGVLIDQIGEVVKVDRSAIKDRRADDHSLRENKERRFSQLGIGICKLHEDLLVVLDARRFLPYIESFLTENKHVELT